MREKGIPIGFQIISRDITERKQAEEALQAEKNKLQSVVDVMEYGLTIQDTDYNILYQSKPSRTFSGYQLGEKCYRAYEGRDKVCDGCPVEKAFRDGKSHTTERRVVTPSGEVLFLENTANPIRDAEGKIASCLEIARDITERRQAEEALRQSQEKLRQMFESVTDGISVVDLHGLITEVNQRTLEMHGFSSRDELLGKSALELVAPCDHEKIAANMQKALERGIVRGVEYTLLKADGTEFPGELSTSVLRDASGKWVGHITIARDITERKKAEQALERQQAYFQQLFDNSPDAIAWLDNANRFVNVNRGFETLFGYRPEEIKGRLISDILVPEDRKEEAASLSQAHSSNEAVRIETVRKRKDGSLVAVSLLAYPVLFGDRAVGSYIIYTDITERKRAEEKLKEAQERLIRSEKLAAIGQLASGVGHELRNPLGAIKNATLYVRRKIVKSELSASEPKVLEFLDIIDEEVDSANKVITDLLSFSRVAKPTVSLINVGSIIKDALGHVAMPENIRVTVDVGPALLMVMVDAAQIRQVFINIILNAAEAMPEGGRLEIRARSKTEFVAVEFADTGCGIPESVTDKIFDPLFTTKPRGVGLGLAMCRSIVERHGGDIGVKSKEGKGTTLSLSLPIRVV